MAGFTWLVGCTPRGSPIVAGPRHLGIGWYVQREAMTTLTSEPRATAPLHIDVEGVGLLFLPGRCAAGYSRTNFVAVRRGDDAHIRLSRLEVFTGDQADAHARTAPGAGAPTPPTLPVPTEEPER